MRALIVNVSPRAKGTSDRIAEHIQEGIRKHGVETELVWLYGARKEMESLIQKARECDTLVVSGPCYVATYPAPAIQFLERLKEEDAIRGKNLYGFIQGGMPYVHTHEGGLRMLEVFAQESGAAYQGGFAMGGGAMLDGQSIDHVIHAKAIVPAVAEFIENVAKGEPSNRRLYVNAQMPVGRVMARGMAIALTAVFKRQFKKKGIDYKQTSPYLTE